MLLVPGLNHRVVAGIITALLLGWQDHNNELEVILDLTAVCKTAASGKWVRSPPNSPYKNILLTPQRRVPVAQYQLITKSADGFAECSVFLYDLWECGVNGLAQRTFNPLSKGSNPFTPTKFCSKADVVKAYLRKVCELGLIILVANK